MLPIAIAIAASPAPIAVAVLMLVSARPRANGLAFAFGWITGIAALGALVLALAGTAGASHDDGDPSTWVSLLQLGFGVVLLLLALKSWRGRPEAGDDVPVPAWMGAMHAFTPLKAAAVGVGLSAVNPKNVLFVIAAAATEAQAGLSARAPGAGLGDLHGRRNARRRRPPRHLLHARRARPTAARSAERLAHLQQDDGDGGALPVIGATLIGNAIGGLSA